MLLTASTPLKNGRLQFDAHGLARALQPLMAKGVRAKQVGPIQLSFTGDWPGTIEVTPSTFLSLLRGVPESGSESSLLSC